VTSADMTRSAPGTALALWATIALSMALAAQAQTIPADDVADALDSLKSQAVAKIDQDLDYNARAFADAKNIQVSARWSDWFSPFLDIARAVYDGLTAIQVKSPTSVRSWVKTSLQTADSAQKVFSLANSFDRFWQDGQNLQLAFEVLSGPAALSGNIVMLTGTGLVTMRASQAGDSMYAAAANVDQAFDVAPPNHTLANPQRLPDGSFQMDFFGVTGNNYTLLASTNLINWEPIASFIATNSSSLWRDSVATNFNWRFYRIVAP